MLLISWNLGYAFGFKATHQHAWEYVASLDPDIALVQEAVVPGWAEDKWTVLRSPGSGWGSVILAKPRFNLREIDASTELNIKGGLVTAIGVVKLEDGAELLVVSVHAPVLRGGAREIDLGGRDVESLKLSAYQTASLRDVAYVICRDLVKERRFVVSGDWNTSPILWDRNHPKDCEAEFFSRAEADGWVNCYRKFHEGEGRTWFRKNDPPYQLDHAFCDSATAEALRNCRIDVNPAERMGLSDHAPLILKFDLAPSCWLASGGFQ
jgi:hypothetical protein